MANRRLLMFILPWLLSACALATADSSEPQPAALVGIWSRPSASGAGNEGLCLQADGTAALFGILDRNGQQWRHSDGKLVVSTNTSHAPQPTDSTLHVDDLSASGLRLSAADDALAGAYQRAPDAATVIRGTVTYRQRIALPPDAAVHLTVSVIRDQTAASIIASTTVATAGRQVPIPFQLCAHLDPAATLRIATHITSADRVLFVGSAVGTAAAMAVPLELVVNPSAPPPQ